MGCWRRLCVDGKLAEALQIAVALEAQFHESYVSPEALARLYVALDEMDVAMQHLDEAYRMCVDTLNSIKVEPCYDNIRSAARFEVIIDRMNFPK